MPPLRKASNVIANGRKTDTTMKISTIHGYIDRRILINFTADPKAVEKIIPFPFRPKIYKDKAIVGICLIRLKSIKPKGLPDFIGVSSENGAHRIAVEWDENGETKSGVYIPRRDTSLKLNTASFAGQNQSDAHTDLIEPCNDCPPLCKIGLFDMNDELSINIFPNPTDGIVNYNITNSTGEVLLQVFDLKGKLLYNKNINKSDGTLNISKFPSGIYLFKLADNSNSTSHLIQVNK